LNTCLPWPCLVYPSHYFPVSAYRSLFSQVHRPHLLANVSGRFFFSRIRARCTLSHMVSLFFFSFCSPLIPPPPLLSQVHRDPTRLQTRVGFPFISNLCPLRP
jgi:hypothetical protein